MAELASAPLDDHLIQPEHDTTTLATSDDQVVGAVGEGDAKTAPSGDKAAATSDATVPPVNASADETPAPPQLDGPGNDAEEKATGATGGANAPTNAASSSKKKEKRKSTAGIPEHRIKKTPNKRKSMVELHLDVQPGQYWFAVLKGYPPWPAIVCDEEMLPENLLATRPVTAKRANGTYREDFEEGGKKVSERTYPVMYLKTNEFGWIPNTDLKPLTTERLKEEKASGKLSKKKQLSEAYDIALEQHDLDHFKAELKAHAEAVQEEAEKREARKADKAAKGKKKAAKQEAVDMDEEMEDVVEESDEPAPKSSKKRKKDMDSEGEAKPAKTPKTKLKVHGPKGTPNGESAAKSKSKAKPKKVDKPEEKELTAEEKYESKAKTVMFFRHRLQKGLISRATPPTEDEMPGIVEIFDKLENYKDLELGIIRETKIHKVLKAIMKVQFISGEEKYQLRKRCAELLVPWNKALASSDADKETKASATKDSVEAEAATESAAANGVAEKVDGQDAIKEGQRASKERLPDPEAEVEDKRDENASGDEEPSATSVEKDLVGDRAKDEAGNAAKVDDEGATAPKGEGDA